MWLAAYELPFEKSKVVGHPQRWSFRKCKKDLEKLGFINDSFQLSDLGQQVLKLPLHPKHVKPLLSGANQTKLKVWHYPFF